MAIVAEIMVFVGVFAASNGIIDWWKGQIKVKAKGHRPPAFPSLPFIGSLPYIHGWNNIGASFLASKAKVGPIFTVKVGQKEILVLNDRASIEAAFVRQSAAFSGRALVYIEKISNPRRKGMTSMTTSPEWKRFHQMSLSILKEFGFGIKNLMEERILTEVKEVVGHLRERKGQTFNPKDLISMVGTNIITGFMFGRRLSYDEGGVSELFLQTRRFAEGIDFAFDVAPLIRFLPPYRRKLHLINDSLVLIFEIIRQEIDLCKQPDAEDSFVRSYLEREGRDCDEEQLLFTLKDLLIAGSDTSIATFLWSLVALANHPLVQGRMRTEIDAVVPRDQFPTMSDQQRLPYTMATILEIMRWKTLVPLGVPRETLSDATVNGYFIPRGTMVIPNIHAVHMDPKVWKDPEEFRPERFLDDEGNKVIGQDRLIPFSLGRRSCFGEVLARAEIFLVVSSLVQNFVIRPPDGVDEMEVRPVEPIGLTMVPSPFDIQLVPREMSA